MLDGIDALSKRSTVSSAATIELGNTKLPSVSDASAAPAISSSPFDTTIPVESPGGIAIAAAAAALAPASKVSRISAVISVMLTSGKFVALASAPAMIGPTTVPATNAQ